MMDYPNTEVVFNVTNNTGKDIGKGWTLEFEAPKTFVSNGAEMGTAQVTDIPNSDLVKVKLTSTDYKGIGAGETVPVWKNDPTLGRICFPYLLPVYRLTYPWSRQVVHPAASDLRS